MDKRQVERLLKKNKKLIARIKKWKKNYQNRLAEGISTEELKNCKIERKNNGN